MLKLLERSVASVGERMVLLAPPNATGHEFFRNVEVDHQLRSAFVRQMQRLRGDVYLQDSAISRQQLISGRHETPEDERSWHLLMLDREHEVTACIRYLEHDTNASVDSLRARSCPLAADAGWSHRFYDAVTEELAAARRLGMRFAEIGGWAVAPQHRCTSEGLVLALAAYSLGRISGGAFGLTTATVRHASSTILRRLGGTPLSSADGPLPAYFDPHYNCEMELLRFDSRRPATRFASLIESLRVQLSMVQVVASQALSAIPVCLDTPTPSAALLSGDQLAAAAA
jgi:hypothetical protein